MVSPMGTVVSNASPARLPGSEPLIGTYVTLERFSKQHVDDLYLSVGVDDSMWMFVPTGPFPDKQSFADMLDEGEKSSVILYAVVPESGGRSAGIISLFAIDLPNQVIEIGAVYGEKLQRSQASTEAIYLVGQAIFSSWGFRRMEWRCNSLNLPSIQAANRYGFIYNGTLRQHMIVRGRNRDTAVYSILDGEWPLRKQAFEQWLDDANFDKDGQQQKRLSELRHALDQ